MKFVRRVHGGLCYAGPCVAEVTVRDEGRWTARGVPEPADTGGAVEPGAASRLAGVLQEGWETVTAEPFRGTCPTAYDGPETIYTVTGVAGRGAGDVLLELSSCAYDLERPEAAEVLDRLKGLWDEFGLPR